MEITIPIDKKTVFAEATVGEDSVLYLNKRIRSTLKPGDKVALTISPISQTVEKNSNSLIGTVTHYEDPFGSSTLPEEWEALSGC